VQNAFAGKPWEDLFGRGNRGSARVVLRCYFFDKDGVVFIKQPPGKIQGEVTGKKGDSFRITQTWQIRVSASQKQSLITNIPFRHYPRTLIKKVA
jgi:hypothetical protein